MLVIWQAHHSQVSCLLQLTGTLPTWLGTLNVTQLEVEENKVEAPCCVAGMAHCLLLAFCARSD